jgi:hypothetical protein
VNQDLRPLEQRWRQLVLRRERLAERERLAAEEEARVKAEVAQAQVLIEDSPHVREWLEQLQHAQHERAVGAYERMLTAFLQDVLPGDRRAVLELATEKGLPALQFFIRKGENQPLEDVIHGTGGSIANILSTGLRFIALMRSGKRRFLVLDEADCWMRPSRATGFAQVINNLARQLGVQVLYISHHEKNTLEGIFSHCLHLHHEQGVLTTDWTEDEASLGWEADQVGLRSITLQDFQAHQSTFIPLSPGVTLLYGDNDIGKSAVVTALRAAIENDSNDTVIRHGTTGARVTLDFGPEGAVHWERVLKGKAKTSYQWVGRGALPGDKPMASSTGRTRPDWMGEALGLGTIDELDVQIGRQKKPIFLLDEPPSMRAKALAVGHDGGYVQAMLAQERTELAEAKNVVKNGEKALERWRRVRMALLPLAEPGLNPGRWNDLTQARTRNAQMVGLRAAWASVNVRNSILSKLPGGDVVLPAAPRASRLIELGRRWTHIAQQHAILAPLSETFALEVPAAPRATAMTAQVDAWRKNLERHACVRRHPETELVWPAERWSGRAKDHHGRWQIALRRRVVLDNLHTGMPTWPETRQAPLLMQAGKAWLDHKTMAERLHQENGVVEHDLALLQVTLDNEAPHCPTCGQSWHGCKD